jgi:hypothetical protein
VDDQSLAQSSRAHWLDGCLLDRDANERHQRDVVEAARGVCMPEHATWNSAVEGEIELFVARRMTSRLMRSRKLLDCMSRGDVCGARICLWYGCDMHPTHLHMCIRIHFCRKIIIHPSFLFESVAYGADLHARNAKGETPRDYLRHFVLQTDDSSTNVYEQIRAESQDDRVVAHGRSLLRLFEQPVPTGPRAFARALARVREEWILFARRSLGEIVPHAALPRPCPVDEADAEAADGEDGALTELAAAPAATCLAERDFE